MIQSQLHDFNTFRDPAGSLRIEKGRVLRKVQPQFATSVRTFLESEMAAEWVNSGRMVASRVLSVRIDGALELEHDRIFFPSYPWEWCIEQWVSAALLTLDLCEQLLGQGLILKDATPLNILFRGTQPVLVDVLSVERRELTSPLWNAYGQFMRTFILPMIAYKYLGWPLKTSCFRRDGYEPETLYSALSWAQLFRSPVWSSVALPVLLGNSSRKSINRPSLHLSADAAEDILKRRLRALKRMVIKLQPGNKSSRWSDYEETAQHYSSEDHQCKDRFVANAIELSQAQTVLDVGANTGAYSRIAASRGANVVALDTDSAATSLNFRRARSAGLTILPLDADIARPTPADGWRNRESLSLLDRCTSRFDCILLLGVLHHLLVTDQIPMKEIALLFAELNPRFLVAEWIPPSDEKFKQICRGREDLYGQLCEQDLKSALNPYFRCTMRQQLENGRSLLLMELR